jgi:hypothetical protein
MMKRATVIAGVGAGLGAGVTAARKLGARLGRSGGEVAPARRVLAVTVNLSGEEFAPGGVLPERLRDLGDEVAVDLRPAPGGKGTEVVARLTGEPDDEVRRRVRLALREAKSLAETGEVLSPDRPGTTEPTVLNKPLREATAHGREEGRL